MGHNYAPSGQALKLPIIFGFFMVLSTAIVALRVYVRKYMVRNFGVDDLTAFIGWFLFNLEGVLAIIGSFHGIGQHQNLIPAEDVPAALLWFWVCGILYFISNMAIKLSIALTLLRFVVHQSHRTTVIGGTIVLLAASVVGTFVFVLQCSPVPYFWTREGGATSGKCIAPNILVITVYIYSVVNCIWDWTMAILPWLMVRKLQLAKTTKIAIAVILSMGSIASLAILVRFAFIHELAYRKDLLYRSTKVAIWVVIEGGLSLVASSMATLKPIFKMWYSSNSTKCDRFSETEISLGCSTDPAFQDKRPNFGTCATYSCTVTANGHVCAVR